MKRKGKLSHEGKRKEGLMKRKGKKESHEIKRKCKVTKRNGKDRDEEKRGGG